MDERLECYVHPDNAAVGACVACGHFVCDVCRVTIDGRIHCKACVERGAASSRPAGNRSRPPPPPRAGSRPLVRSSRDRVFGGVCGGLAPHLGIDVTLTRVLFAVVTVLTGFLMGGIAYIVLWAVLPLDSDVG